MDIIWILIVIILGANGPERHELRFATEAKCEAFRAWARGQHDIWVSQVCRKASKKTPWKDQQTG